MKYRRFVFSCEEEQADIIASLVPEHMNLGVEIRDKQLLLYSPIDELPEFSGDVKDYLEQHHISYYQEEIDDQNWNAVWENSFDPVVINNQVRIRASHQKVDDSYPYELVITPKMSFGTGHHPTTSLMAEMMLIHWNEPNSLLDFGSGTGVLGILAEKLGCKSILAIDNDKYAADNIVENIEVNNCEHITFKMGDIDQAQQWQADWIIANVTRNVICERTEALNATLKSGGNLFCSGFFEEDISEVSAAFKPFGIEYQEHISRNNWTAVRFLKN